MGDENFGSFLAKHYRVLMISVGAVVAVCLVALVGLAIAQIRPAGTYLDVNLAPAGKAVVTINGQEYGNGVFEFEPGEYTAEVSAAGFEPREAQISVAEGTTTKVATFLVNEKEGMEYFERSEADLRVLRTLDDPEAQEFIAAYDKKLAIEDELPINATYNVPIPGYSGNNLYEQKVVDGSGDKRCVRVFCLIVTGDGLNEEVLNNAVNNLGYDLDDYEVIYDVDA